MRPKRIDLWTISYLLRRHWAIALEGVWAVVFLVLFIDFERPKGACLSECLGPASHLTEWLLVQVILLPFFVIGLARLVAEIRDRKGS